MKPGKLYDFVQELKRRRVFRGIVVYGASTLVLFEAAQNLANVFGRESAPPWFLLLLGLGFIASLWFSWIYDITPGGIKKTEADSDKRVHIPKKETRLYQTSTFICVLIIIGLLTYKIIDGAKYKMIKALDKSIAVLPYHNAYSSFEDTEHYIFVGHQITCCLVKVKDYRVRPWKDCRTYHRGNKEYSEIGEELSVSLLVDWTPRIAGEEKHISVDLISADNSDLLWSENYKIRGTWSSEILRLSRKITKQINKELRTYPTPQERALIDEIPTTAQASLLASLGMAMTQDAVELVQTGKQEDGDQKSEYIDSISFDRAIKYFNEAIDEDPEFAEAYANRAKARLWGMRARVYDEGVLGDCEEDIRMAFTLKPNLPEAHIAMAFYHFYGRNDFQLALLSFENAIDLQPDNNEYLFYLAKIQSAMGNWEKVKPLIDKVYKSNTRNALYLSNMGITYLFMHDFSRALECQNRAILNKPYWYAPYINKIITLLSLGRIDDARFVADEAKNSTGRSPFRMRAELDLYEGKFADAMKNIELAGAEEFKALGESPGEAYLLKAKIYKHAGEAAKAEENFNRARDYYLASIDSNPAAYFSFIKLGLAHAGLGMYKQAIENGHQAQELMENKISSIHRPSVLYDMAQIYTLTGDYESANTAIDDLLNSYTPYTFEYIKLDPDMKQLLHEPG
jgi:tetratricopeptide (TPR) repeat protein